MKEKLTINEMMSLMKTVRERVNSLKGLRDKVSTLEKYSWVASGETQKTTEPQYDVKKVDAKIMELENFLYKADSKIKKANAQVRIDYEVDSEELLKPLE